MGIKCCYKCEERTLGCHSRCKKYQEEFKKAEKLREERFKRHESFYDYRKKGRK